jgi:hypothetical protein
MVISIIDTLSANFVGYDTTIWSLDSKGVFTVRSMYLFFLDGEGSLILLSLSYGI